jgi:hypothetical protein
MAKLLWVRGNCTYKLLSFAISLTTLYRKVWKIAVGEGKLYINGISKVISLLKWFHSSCDSSVLCVNVLHHMYYSSHLVLIFYKVHVAFWLECHLW